MINNWTCSCEMQLRNYKPEKYSRQCNVKGNTECNWRIWSREVHGVRLILNLKKIIKEEQDKNGSLQNKVREFSCNLIVQLPKSNVVEDKGALINTWKINLERQRAGRGRRWNDKFQKEARKPSSVLAYQTGCASIQKDSFMKWGLVQDTWAGRSTPEHFVLNCLILEVNNLRSKTAN